MKKIKKNQKITKTIVQTVVQVHSGKSWELLPIRAVIINCKIGEFVFTKKSSDGKK